MPQLYPPLFAICLKLNFLVLPRLAFILGRIALIFQNRFAFTSFFRNSGFAEVTMHLEMQKKNSFSFAFHSFFRTFAASKIASV